MSFIKIFFSGEFLFFAFLYAGLFKGALNFPIDLTVFFAALSALVAAKRVIRKPSFNNKIFLPIFLYLIFTIILLISLLYTSGSSYTAEKSLKFLTVTSWAFIGAPLLIRNKESVIRFIKSGIFIMIIISFYIISEYLTGGVNLGAYSRVGVDSGPVIGLARGTGIAAISVVFLYVYNKVNLQKKFISIVLISILLFTMFLTGTRMPLLSLIAVLMLLVVYSFKVKNKALKINKGILPLIFASMISMVMLIPFADKFSNLLFRLEVLFYSYGGGSSVSERSVRYDTAWKMLQENPFIGKGFGSFPLFYGGIDQREYPHNIFLEVLSELGILGFIFFSALLMFAIFRLIKYSHENYFSVHQKSIVFIFIFVFLNANVSGDINDNRIFFTFLSMLYLIPLYGSAEVKEIKRHDKLVQKNITVSN